MPENKSQGQNYASNRPSGLLDGLAGADQQGSQTRESGGTAGLDGPLDQYVLRLRVKHIGTPAILGGVQHGDPYFDSSARESFLSRAFCLSESLFQFSLPISMGDFAYA